MKTCSICNRISASGEDHLDCVQKRKVELEEEHLKQSLPEKLDSTQNQNDLSTEIRAILDHLTREKNQKK